MMADTFNGMYEGAGVATLENLAGKYLTFRLANEEYGLQILKVQEIISLLDVTHIPQVPDFVRGVINLRGKIIPIADLRLKFGMPGKEDSDRTSIIVVGLSQMFKSLTMGIVVDEVSEVRDIAEGQIEPAPSFGTKVKTDFILGMGKVDKRVLTLLDIDRVLSEAEVETVASAMEN
jgi:purine-binding chemotaxis protein CheW